MPITCVGAPFNCTWPSISSLASGCLVIACEIIATFDSTGSPAISKRVSLHFKVSPFIICVFLGRSKGMSYADLFNQIFYATDHPGDFDALWCLSDDDFNQLDLKMGADLEGQLAQIKEK